MNHPFLEAVAFGLASRGVATLRYQFPYMERGRRRPDSPRVLESAVRCAIELAARVRPEIPIVAGGKSMGGRISSRVAAFDRPDELRGLIFLGYPLHGAGRPDTRRAQHLTDIKVPLLFLQGTRDSLAEIDLMRSVVGGLGAGASLHVVEGADHSFRTLKRSGRKEAEVMDEIVDGVSRWAECALQL